MSGVRSIIARTVEEGGLSRQEAYRKKPDTESPSRWVCRSSMSSRRLVNAKKRSPQDEAHNTGETQTTGGRRGAVERARGGVRECEGEVKGETKTPICDCGLVVDKIVPCWSLKLGAG